MSCFKLRCPHQCVNYIDGNQRCGHNLCLVILIQFVPVSVTRWFQELTQHQHYNILRCDTLWSMRGQLWLSPVRALGLASPGLEGVEQTKLWWSGAKTDITSDWWDYYLALIAPWVRAINTEQPSCGQSEDKLTLPWPIREWECDQGFGRGFIAIEKRLGGRVRK